MKRQIKSSASRRIFQVFNYIFLLLITIICIYPFWYVVIYTLSDSSKIGEIPPVLIPTGFSIENYVQILNLKGFLPAFGISVARTLAGTILSVGSCSFLGYLFSKENMPFRKFLYRFLILTMYISGGMIATYIVIKSYGMLNSFMVYIIPGMISAYNVVLIKTYVESLPASLEESAKLDGAGIVTVFTKIIFPLSKPIIATVAVFVAVGQWNSWFDNHIYTRGTESLKTLQYLLYNYLNEAQRIAEQLRNATSGVDAGTLMQQISSKGIRMSITVLAALPIFLVYPFMQKYFVKGIMVGAVKG
nr:carbohydrate ABC transporter permease [uncultured Catonella sp.]